MKGTPVVIRRKEEALAGGGLGFFEAMESPCASCESAPCCSHLPLPGFPVENLLQVDHARWLLGFDAIELGISVAGDWSVFYTGSCRFLDPSDNSCTLHDSPAQPAICRHYNPYTCWYRRALGPGDSPEFLRVDVDRFALLLPHLRFDDERNLVGVPTWETMQQLFASTPVRQTAPTVSAPAVADPVLSDWREIALGRRQEPPPVSLTAASAIGADRCGSCAAYCCESLQFPIDPPSSVTSIDYLRFALGFQGVELGIAADGWSFIVRTRCRHLRGNRCSLFGLPDRPLRCRYFDAAQCPYPTLLGDPRPPGFVRLGLENLGGLEDCLSFDGAGNLRELPTVDQIRDAIEARWVGAAALAVR